MSKLLQEAMCPDCGQRAIVVRSSDGDKWYDVVWDHEGGKGGSPSTRPHECRGSNERDVVNLAHCGGRSAAGYGVCDLMTGHAGPHLYRHPTERRDSNDRKPEEATAPKYDTPGNRPLRINRQCLKNPEGTMHRFGDERHPHRCYWCYAERDSNDLVSAGGPDDGLCLDGESRDSNDRSYPTCPSCGRKNGTESEHVSGVWRCPCGRNWKAEALDE